MTAINQVSAGQTSLLNGVKARRATVPVSIAKPHDHEVGNIELFLPDRVNPRTLSVGLDFF